MDDMWYLYWSFTITKVLTTSNKLASSNASGRLSGMLKLLVSSAVLIPSARRQRIAPIMSELTATLPSMSAKLLVKSTLQPTCDTRDTTIITWPSPCFIRCSILLPCCIDLWQQKWLALLYPLPMCSKLCSRVSVMSVFRRLRKCGKRKKKEK